MTELPAKQHVLDLTLSTVRPSITTLLATQDLDYAGFDLALRSACRKNPTLVAALGSDNGRRSFCEAVLFAARVGLVPDPMLHHFAFVPYRQKDGSYEVVGITEFRGLLHLMMQTGLYDEIRADVVYQGEAGTPWILPDGTPNHSVDPFNRDDQDGHIVGAYAFARVKGRDRPVLLTLSRKALLSRVRKLTTFYETQLPAMLRKNAIRALAQSGLVPLGRHGALAAALQDDEEDIRPAVVTEIEAPASDKPPELSHMDAADALNFQQREKEPLPSAEVFAADTYAQIVALAKERGIKPKGLDEIAQGVCGKNMTDVQQQESLDSILAAVRAAPTRGQ